MALESLKCPECGAAIYPEGDIYICDFCGVQSRDRGAGIEALGLPCPECKTYNTPGERICGRCGHDLYKVLYRICPYCGDAVRRNRHFCSDCARNISPETSAKVVYADNLIASIRAELAECRRQTETAIADCDYNSDGSIKETDELAGAEKKLRETYDKATNEMKEVRKFTTKESKALNIDMDNYLRYFIASKNKVRTEVPFIAIGTELRSVKKVLDKFRELW